MSFDARLYRQIQQHPYPMIFTTISGAHLYGFPSPDSDYDLRGVHVLPLRDVIGLQISDETVETAVIDEGLEIDIVTHDAHKFFNLMLKKNGYLLEQILSPLVLHSTPEHDELKEIAVKTITRFHGHHYLGFSATQWKLFQKEPAPRVKPLLYVFRILLTGIHLVRTGEVEANLLHLNEHFKLPYIPDILERKITGTEKGVLGPADMAFFEREYQRLTNDLEQAIKESHLPEHGTASGQLNDLLIRLRLKSLT